MVSRRCKMMVKEELQKLGIMCTSIELGMVEIMKDICKEKHDLLKMNLMKSGLELLDNKRSILVESIKNVITEMIQNSNEIPKVNYSDFISEKLGYDYTYLANVFSEVKGTTIQHYIILNKIEKAKELLLYDELSLTEIAYRLNYSSVAHLSNQFKKITGLTPTFYKGIAKKRRGNLERI
ncbi:MAG: AraC-like DNA-binding protein [Luteibaculaceae bacterium]|jgi:AraC-like DNA-binding protein